MAAGPVANDFGMRQNSQSPDNHTLKTSRHTLLPLAAPIGVFTATIHKSNQIKSIVANSLQQHTIHTFIKMIAINTSSQPSELAKIIESLRGQGRGVSISDTELEALQKEKGLAIGYKHTDLDKDGDGLITEYDADKQYWKYIRQGPNENNHKSNNDAHIDGQQTDKPDQNAGRIQNSSDSSEMDNSNHVDENHDTDVTSDVEQYNINDNSMHSWIPDQPSHNDFQKIPGGGGAEMNFVDLFKGKDKQHWNGTINTKGADYIIITSSNKNQYEPTGNVASHFNIPSELKDRIVGSSGAKDATMVLIDIRGIESFEFRGKNEPSFSLIRNVPYNKKFVVDSDNANGSNTTGYTDPQVHGGKGMAKPINVEASPWANRSDILIWKEDQNDDSKDNEMKNADGVYFNHGIDNAMFVTDNFNSLKHNANGCLMALSLVDA